MGLLAVLRAFFRIHKKLRLDSLIIIVLINGSFFILAQSEIISTFEYVKI